MKNFTSLIILLLTATILRAQGLACDAERPLIDHLVEVNKEWKHQAPRWEIFSGPVSFQSDDDRIKTHLLLVEQILREREVAGLTPNQLKNRHRQLDVLRQYWQRGVFPRNTGHAQRQPYFIDSFGTACAVGYLALQDGQKKLVERINRENNFAYIRDMDYPDLLGWAGNNGLTEGELAWIQPGYPPQPRPFGTLGNGGGVIGHVNVMEVVQDGNLLVLAGDFTIVDGVEASSIIFWDGEEWKVPGSGVTGEIFAVASVGNKLFAGGDFYLPDNPEQRNLACWDGEQWTGVQTGDMEGSVLALEAWGPNLLYVGGEFKKVNGQNMPYFARYIVNFNEWTNSAVRWINGSQTEIEGAMEVNGPVRDFENINYRLLVGGGFTLTAPNADPQLVNQLEAGYLAYWADEDWLTALNGDHGPVTTVCYCDGDLYVGGRLGGELPGVSTLRAGLWSYEEYAFQPFGDSLIHGFEVIDDDLLVFGGLHYSPDLGYFGEGMAIGDGFEWQGYAFFDNTVRDVVKFQEKMIITGDFEYINDEPFQNLVQLDLVTGSRQPASDLGISVTTDQQHLYVKYQSLPGQASMTLFNLQGQPLRSLALPSGSGEETVSIHTFPSGVYAYLITQGNARQSGKFVVMNR